MSAAAKAGHGLREIRLYGVLGRKFGRVHRLAVGSVREAMHALSVVLPGFAQHLLEHSLPGYHVFIGKRGEGNIGADELERPVSAREPICVVPVVAGAKNGGLFQTIIGAALLTVGVFTGNPFLVQIGASMTIGGVVQMIAAHRMGSPEPKAEGVPSYHFDGPVNTTQEGLPVPLRYGRVICGGAIISAGIMTDDVRPAAAPAPMPPQPLPPNEPLDPIGGSGNWEGSA